jgi:transcriptional regulator of heat shock response
MRRALAVLVTDTGWVTARPINTAPRGGSEELRETGRALTRRFRGKTFQEILDDLAAPADPLDPLWTRSRGVLDEVVALLRDRTLYLSGATNMRIIRRIPPRCAGAARLDKARLTTCSPAWPRSAASRS